MEGNWSKCNWCGKVHPSGDKYRGLCIDCFDEALINEIGNEAFDKLVTGGFMKCIAVAVCKDKLYEFTMKK